MELSKGAKWEFLVTRYHQSWDQEEDIRGVCQCSFILLQYPLSPPHTHLNKKTSHNKIASGTTCLGVYERHAHGSWTPKTSSLKIRMNICLFSKTVLKSLLAQNWYDIINRNFPCFLFQTIKHSALLYRIQTMYKGILAIFRLDFFSSNNLKSTWGKI